MQKTMKVKGKRGAERDVDVPTLGQVAEEKDFAPLRELLEAVKNRPVDELGQDLRVWLREKATNIGHLPLALAFFGACDARAEAPKRVRGGAAAQLPGE